MRLPYVVAVQERREQVPDENGAVSATWADVEKRRCDIEPLKASERIAATAVQGVLSHRVTMRNGGRIVKPKDRLVFMGRVFEVDGVVPELARPGKQVASVVEVVDA